MKKISFCTTCRNRLWQLKQTLPINLSIIDDENEIVLVDYGSSDGLSDWVWSNYEKQIQSGVLRFFEVKNEVRWNMARAKNLSHRLGLGDYLFNTDADNFITLADLHLVKKAVELNLHSHQWSGDWDDGTHGRIGIPKKLFKLIGGYDETLLSMGGQDIDLLHRLRAMKLNKAKLAAPELRPIQNTKTDKIKETSNQFVKLADHNFFYGSMNKLSLEISKFRLDTEGPIRVGGGFSYIGVLNGKNVTFSGFDEIREVL